MAQVRNILADVKKIDTIETNVSQLQTEITNFDPLPDQTGKVGKYLKTDGALASWETLVIPTTVSSFTNDAGYQTLSQVNTAIAGLVDSSPAALDTLNELATALGNDANFSTTITNSLASKASLSGATFSGDVAVNGVLEVKNPSDNNRGYMRVGTANDGFPFVTIGGRTDTAFGTIDAGWVDAWYLRAVQTLYVGNHLSLGGSIGTVNQFVAKTSSGVSWSDIKTINGNTLLGAGNIVIPVYTDSDVGAYLTNNNYATLDNVNQGLASKADQSTTYTKTEVDTGLALKANKSNVLELNNTTAYSPSATYHPATKGYVDAMASSGGGNVSITKGYTFTANGSTTTFDCGAASSYILGAVDIYYNGMQLDSTDYTAADGRNFTLGFTPENGGLIKLVAYGGADVYTKTQTNTLLDAKANLGGATFTGTVNVGNNIYLSSTDMLIGTSSGIGVGAKVNILSGGNALHVKSSSSSANNIVSYDSSGNQRFSVSNSGYVTASNSLRTNGTKYCAGFDRQYGYGGGSWTTIFTLPSSFDSNFWAKMHAYATENGATSHYTFYFSAVVRHNGSPYGDFYNFTYTADANLQPASSSGYVQFRFTNNGVTNGPIYFQAYNSTYWNNLYIYDVNAYGLDSISWA